MDERRRSKYRELVVKQLTEDGHFGEEGETRGETERKVLENEVQAGFVLCKVSFWEL